MTRHWTPNSALCTLYSMSVDYQTLDTNLPASSPFSTVETLYQLGSLLRDVRRSQEKEIATVAADLRLKANFIEALESGEWENLPSETYGRGYLRHYAEYLNLSPIEATECCQRIKGKIEPKLHYLNIASSKDTVSKGTLWFFAIAVIFTVMGWAAYKESTVELVEPIITPPEGLSVERVKAIQLNHTVDATCLNIPQKTIAACYRKTPSKPSFLLKSANIYPIWIR